MIVYLLVTIDTECDKDHDWCVRRPLHFSSITTGIPERLMPLFDLYQVKPTFLLSPEVVQDDASVRVLSAIKNCELGTHLHGEFISPGELNGTIRTDTPQFLYPPEVERQKLANLTELFESRFGYYPKSFRAGRFGAGRHTAGFLEQLGYEVDSSVTPFWTHDFEGRGANNYWGAPVQPYYPSRNELREPGHSSILEIPVTVLNPLLVRWPCWVLKRMNNSTRWHLRVLRRLGVTVPRTLWLRPQRSTAQELIFLADQVVNRYKSSPSVVLNMMYHSVEVIPGASPYATTDAEVQSILDSQAALFAHLSKTYEFHSVGLSEIKSRITVGLRAGQS